MFEVDLSPCQKNSLGRLTSFFGGVLIGLPPDHRLGKSNLFSYQFQIESCQLQIICSDWYVLSFLTRCIFACSFICKIMQNPTKSYFGDFTNPSESLLFLHLRLTPKTLSLAFHAGDRGSNPLGDAM